MDRLLRVSVDVEWSLIDNGDSKFDPAASTTISAVSVPLQNLLGI